MAGVAQATVPEVTQSATTTLVVLLGNISATEAASVNQTSVPNAALVAIGKGPLDRVPDSRIEGLLRTAREQVTDLGRLLALLDEIQALFDRMTYPSANARRVAVAALCETIMQGRSGGERARARRAAKRLASLFGRVDIDTARYPPSVQHIVREARVELEAKGLVILRVGDASIARGVVVELHSRGQLLARGGLPLEVRLPPGEYSLWLDQPGLRSALYPVSLGEGRSSAQLRMNSSLDGRLSFNTYLRLRCTSSCAESLRRIGQRLGVRTVAATSLSQDRSAIVVNHINVASGQSEVTRQPRSPRALGLDHGPRFPAFSAMYLLPLGVGQFSQGRYVSAVGYSAIQVGLGVWVAISLKQLQRQTQQGSLKGRNRLYNQVNISVSLLVGAAVVSVVEALVVGAVQGG